MRAAARAAGLIAVAEDLAGEFSLRPLLERILRRCTELLGCDAGSICSVDEAVGTYRKEADIGVACQSGRVFPLTEGMTGAVVARRAPVWFARYDDVPGGHDDRRTFGPDDADLLRLLTRTMGMALTSCTPPAKGSPLFELGEDEMEMGVGIHGEPGRRREKLASANEIIDELLEAAVSDLPYNSGDDVTLMINGLGGTPISELYLLYGRAHSELAKRGINVRRNYVGEYCTSLDMAGTSLTLSRLDAEIDELLGAPAEIAIRTF